jgi:hypothetical protein
MTDLGQALMVSRSLLLIIFFALNQWFCGPKGAYGNEGVGGMI